MNPILRDIPQSFTAERLLIRCPLPGDGAEVNAAVAESRDRLRPWMPWALNPETVDETETHRRRAYVHFLERSDLPLHLYLTSTGEFVGGSGLNRNNWDVPKFEIGDWICVTR